MFIWVALHGAACLTDIPASLKNTAQLIVQQIAFHCLAFLAENPSWFRSAASAGQNSSLCQLFIWAQDRSISSHRSKSASVIPLVKRISLVTCDAGLFLGCRPPSLLGLVEFALLVSSFVPSAIHLCSLCPILIGLFSVGPFYRFG
ncbi:hypothetical protein DSO57_1005955 [Entomophthora muscae]|uniref:Uncharacterized protein n=1 Tax=Entomophthora muscae TaxID=34485 RepID=A0ACC2TV65_9FUNG|nr:hypothetical protein DSO57_1005955 [Entomophthora muscae]